MVFRRRTQRGALDRAEQSVALSAYALLEEARLRCQRVRDTTHQEAERASLKLIHRDLGIAGYLASSSLDPDRRGALLAVAHRHADQSVQDEIPVLIETALLAEQAVQRALDDPVGCEHLHGAQTHLNHALELLERHATTQTQEGERMTDVTAGRSAGTPQNPLRDPTRGREDWADLAARRDPTSASPRPAPIQRPSTQQAAESSKEVED